MGWASGCLCSPSLVPAQFYRKGFGFCSEEQGILSREVHGQLPLDKTPLAACIQWALGGGGLRISYTVPPVICQQI